MDTLLKIDLENLVGYANGQKWCMIKLVTTKSAALGAIGASQKWMTEWIWYWQDEQGKWVKYGDVGGVSVTLYTMYVS